MARRVIVEDSETEQEETEQEETEEKEETEKKPEEKPEPKQEKKPTERASEPSRVKCPTCRAYFDQEDIGFHEWEAHGTERRASGKRSQKTAPHAVKKKKGPAADTDKDDDGQKPSHTASRSWFG